jgi:tRNA A37 threonylcarbamoyladenosine biosynthesis protein TsaE
VKSPEQQEDDEFENEVRRIARHLWPSAQYDGAAVLLGDFGAGKSMTLREMYWALKKRYLRDKSVRKRRSAAAKGR